MKMLGQKYVGQAFKLPTKHFQNIFFVFFHLYWGKIIKLSWKIGGKLLRPLALLPLNPIIEIKISNLISDRKYLIKQKKYYFN